MREEREEKGTMPLSLFRMQAELRGSAILSLFLALCAATSGYAAPPPTPYPLEILPGTAAEVPFLQKNSGTSIDKSVRHFDPGQFCVYRIPALPLTECRLEIGLESSTPENHPEITILGPGNKPLPFRMEATSTGGFSISWTAPAKWPIGASFAVLISARTAPLSLQSLRLFHQERDSRDDGVPDALAEWLRSGLPPAIQPTRSRSPEIPFTITATNQGPVPDQETSADVILLQDAPESAISEWAARGRTVWERFPAFIPSNSTIPAADRMQTGADGKPITDNTGIFPAPLPSRTLEETKKVTAALAHPVDGICISDPGYWAKAGYESVFRQTWQSRFRSEWQDPARGLDARYRASGLMATLTAERVQALLQEAQQQKPIVHRIVALRSPFESARNGWISPNWQIDAQPAVTDLIALMSDAELESPLRYNGVRRALPFARAYVGYSALRNITRDRDRRLWLSLDAGGAISEDLASAALSRGRFEQAITAALLTEGAENFVLPSIRQAGKDAALATEFNTLSTVLENIHSQSPRTSLPQSDIGVLVSDTLQWQQGGPDPGDPEEGCSLGLPLLQQGIPVQMASLERSVDPGYLGHFKTLLLSYDSQKSLSARTQEALASWVRQGGSLIFFGGSDRYNEVRSSWWRTAGLYAPQEDLWNRLDLKFREAPTVQKPASQDLSQYTTLTHATGSIGSRTVVVDLTRFAHRAGGCAVRFSANSGGSAALHAAELRVGGRLAASYVTGSDLESRFLVYDDRSQFSRDARSVYGSAAWTYQFDSLPKDSLVLLTLQIEGDLHVEAAPAQSDPGHTLLSTGQAPGLSDLFPRLRLGASYPATLYALPASSFTLPLPARARPRVTKVARNEESRPIPLYTLRSGGAPIWMQNVERGLMIHVGIAPGFFTAGARSGGLLRALTRLAYQRAGGIYREPGFMRVKRGRVTVVQTFHAARFIEGRTVDLFSSTLDVAQNRLIPPYSSALLYTLDTNETRPHLGFVSGRIQAQLETETTTAFFVRGPRASRGAARIDRAGKHPKAVSGVDRLGRPVLVEKSIEGGTLLLRYPNDPDGIAVRIDWVD